MKKTIVKSTVRTAKCELWIDDKLVRSLLKEQFPELMYLPINFFDSGLDNVVFRLGDQLSVRLPRRKEAAMIIENEQIWLPSIHSRLNIPVPIHYGFGKPTKDYPWRWSVLPWLDGVTASQELLSINQAKQFASFLRLLHTSAPLHAPVNLAPAVLLNQSVTFFEQRIKQLEIETKLITQNIKNTWYEALNIPVDTQPKWLHGDLHPGNVLVKNGAISGIIDWGAISSGDIAIDLCSIWTLFLSPEARQQALLEYGNISNATLIRAKGRAISYGLILLSIKLANSSKLATIGKKILRSISEDR